MEKEKNGTHTDVVSRFPKVDFDLSESERYHELSIQSVVRSKDKKGDWYQSIVSYFWRKTKEIEGHITSEEIASTLNKFTEQVYLNIFVGKAEPNLRFGNEGWLAPYVLDHDQRPEKELAENLISEYILDQDTPIKAE